MSLRVDLHLHTTASDGQLTPTALVRLASERGLDIIAITDHDTTNGIAEAQQAAQGSPVIVPGIELSAEDGGDDVHILGYFMDIHHAGFQGQLARFRDDRLHRGKRIVEKLLALGLPVDWERVMAFADGAVGRAHIARAMVEAGTVGTVKEAFDRYLLVGGPAYVARQRLSPEEAIELLRSAGGAAVLAHPGHVPHYETLMVERLIPAGLDGIEVAHPDNPPSVQQRARELAEQYDLVMTGGSDFHDLAWVEREGRAMIGSVTPPEGCVEALRARRRTKSSHLTLC